MSHQKKPGFDIPEPVPTPYAAIPCAVVDAVSFQGARPTAKALLVELIRQHNRKNNGHFQLARHYMKTRGWSSPDVIRRAVEDLIERGLVIRTRQGGLNTGPSRYAVTWLRISNFAELDIQPKEYWPGGWALMNKAPAVAARKVVNTVGGSCQDPAKVLPRPAEIPATLPLRPYEGPAKPVLVGVARPSEGHNVLVPVPTRRAAGER